MVTKTKTKTTKATTSKKPMGAYYDLSHRANKKHKFKATKIIIGIVAVLAVLVAVVVLHSNSQIERLTSGSGVDVFPIENTDYGDLGFSLVVTRDDISLYMFQATIAAEDENFYDSSRVSNITKKLVRSAYFPDDEKSNNYDHENEVTNLVTELEKMYNKDEILLMYLNNNIYGENADGQKIRGVEYAAHWNFDKSAKDLTLTEAAIIASLGDNPAITVRDLSIRKDEILDKMATLGYITAEEAEEAKTAYLPAFE